MKALNPAIEQTGSVIVEVMLSLVLLVVFITSVVGVSLYAQASVTFSGQKSRAQLLAEEGIEAVRNLRDQSFAGLPDGDYGLTLAGNQWQLQAEPDTQGVFTRTISINAVSASKKQVSATVTWAENDNRPGSATLVTYLSGWRGE